MEYRIETLMNERDSIDQSYEEELTGVKAQLAHANQEKDRLAHKLEQSEKANIALVHSTSHVGPRGVEGESETAKLQLERAQLLAKITDMGIDVERRVREAVAAHASSAEAELIIEKQSRQSVETSLADALTELEETKTRLTEEVTKITNNRGSRASEEEVAKLKETMADLQMLNKDLRDEIRSLQAKMDKSEEENKSHVSSLQEKLHQAEERVRLEERESRFEAALASEIANLRVSGNDTTPINNLNKSHHNLVVEESKDSLDQNSIYIIEMYDYVVELKQSINEERQMYKELLAEHEDLLALLGQAGLDGLSFGVCE